MAAHRRVPWRPLCPAGHLPLKGGDYALNSLRQIIYTVRWARRRSCQSPPLEGEMPGRARAP
ncbi:hypothetical protein A9K65_004660 [Mesorhizobium sp. WSM1497]|nr:hypothetical protein A9K65_004660 [Mesorhizobium sp. WSM1497]